MGAPLLSFAATSSQLYSQMRRAISFSIRHLPLVMGMRPLMPDQQAAVAEVFAEFGYEPPRYERYGPCLDFR